MKKYSAYVEFYELFHCKKRIFNVLFTFKTNKELIEKVSKFCKKENVKLVHNHPLAPYLNGSAFDELPYEWLEY